MSIRSYLLFDMPNATILDRIFSSGHWPTQTKKIINFQVPIFIWSSFMICVYANITHFGSLRYMLFAQHPLMNFIARKFPLFCRWTKFISSRRQEYFSLPYLALETSCLFILKNSTTIFHLLSLDMPCLQCETLSCIEAERLFLWH